MAVVVDPDATDPAIGGGGVGAAGWPGAYGSWWQADANDESVVVFLTHSMVTPDQLALGIGFGAWEAVVRVQDAATELFAVDR